MNIYFCGIGGVGLGPLAEIAHDAGHAVFGSDSAQSLMTDHLTSVGINVSLDQSGEFLRQTHATQPIDWFVYSSGIPASSPERQAAEQLGLNTSKRNKLLASIIAEKDMKLIAIAGTHGKTTTTAMAVWGLKQLGVPVSYSVGTTMSFGPSGRYEPGSEYFVYECDEFDRNFLEFHPDLSIITSIGYDHPDTYPDQPDYIAAFTKFINQSSHTIMWHHDHTKFTDELQNTDTLADYDVASVNLPGLHNRQNASLVLEAFKYLGVPGVSADVLNDFPGVDRRFEKLADGLYSDYGHHPVEIAATIELARELSQDVVLVYQPHQNIRQHEVRSLYTDCFDGVSKLYWLPTYLSREDESLEILSPQTLTENVSNKDTLVYSELNDELWQHIQAARSRGALVLGMGAGTIDAWLRAQINSDTPQ